MSHDVVNIPFIAQVKALILCYGGLDGVVFVRVFLCLLLPVVAMAEAPHAEHGFELKVAKLTSSSAKDKATVVSFSVPLVSPHKGRLHKINCRLDAMNWKESDKPIDTLSFVRFEGSKKKEKTHELTAPHDYYGKDLNVYCLAKPRL